MLLVALLAVLGGLGGHSNHDVIGNLLDGLSDLDPPDLRPVVANRTDSLSKVSLLQVPVVPLRCAYHAQNRENQENSNLVCTKLQNQNMQNV